MLVHELIAQSADIAPDREALGHKQSLLSYAALNAEVLALADGLLDIGLTPGERVAIWLPKQPQTVVSIFATSAAGGCFVPINPVLKPGQVAYQLDHSDARVLVTSAQRWQLLEPLLAKSDELQHVILIDGESKNGKPQIHSYSELHCGNSLATPARIDQDMAAILYTSGSTGKPKGVVLSHRNITAGAESVVSYLSNHANDRILSVLPLSFDAGLSQLTTGFLAGARVQLMDYLLPRDVLRAVEKHQVTGITGVPTLWNALARLDWSESSGESLRYLANTGGAMPESTTRALAERLPQVDLFLMYGLTEAFRSTFLPPQKALSKPTSIGKAIPNAEVLIVRPDGTQCEPLEHGELVHRGALVALGYWKNPEATAERFKPTPGRAKELPIDELAVWSGDTAFRDEDGDIFFVSRTDSMIKTSGYRVSPTEIEDEAMAVVGISNAVAIAAPDPGIGQAIVLYVATDEPQDDIEKRLKSTLSASLAAYMLPKRIIVMTALPLNPNGKVDRPVLAQQCADSFIGENV